MRLEELLEQNQKTITETTGLLKRLHEVSISIAEKQLRQLDGLGMWQATAQRQLDAIVGWQAARERTLQLWEAPRHRGRGSRGCLASGDGANAAWPSAKFC
jgi:uncharacterized protein (DUF3084 family)